MAAKEYQINLPTGTVTVWANSAHQAAKRAERQHGVKNVVNQRNFVSNRTDDMTNVKGYGDGAQRGELEEVDA